MLEASKTRPDQLPEVKAACDVLRKVLAENESACMGFGDETNEEKHIVIVARGHMAQMLARHLNIMRALMAVTEENQDSSQN